MLCIQGVVKMFIPHPQRFIAIPILEQMVQVVHMSSPILTVFARMSIFFGAVKKPTSLEDSRCFAGEIPEIHLPVLQLICSLSSGFF